jgi:ribonuclease VapC
VIVATSAIVCLLKDEPAKTGVLRQLLEGDPLRMSTATASELFAVAARWIEPVAQRAVDDLLTELGIELVPYDARQLKAFKVAYITYGRGGHNSSLARLSFGDCFAYALAKVTGEPLLFVGEHFSHTDITPAWPCRRHSVWSP